MKNLLKNFCILMTLLLLPVSSVLASPLKNDMVVFTEMAKQKPQLQEFSSLLVQRLELAREVGVHKWNHQIRIDDQEKDDLYLEKISKKAVTLGVNEDLALAFFVSINEASRDIHIDQFEQWIMSDVHKHKDCLDSYMLEKKLDDLDGRLLSSLKDIEPLLISESSKSMVKDFLSQTLKDKEFSRYVIDSIDHFID